MEVARIVRGADTGKPEVAHEAAGLDSIMTGMAILAKDDHEAIKNAAPVYDALYNNCKLQLIKQRYKNEINKLDKAEKRNFLRKKMKE